MTYTLRAGLVLCLIAWLMAGCASGISHTIVPDYTEREIRLIALVPVDNRTGDTRAARLVRENILEALYFKGYPRIPLSMIDEKLTAHRGQNAGDGTYDIPPEVVGELLGVDAVMYCRLLEWKTSFISIYAPTTVSVLLELKDTAGGATLWSSRYGIVDRHYDFTRKRLELKACQAYEPAVRQIVEEAFASLPDGPDFVGKAPAEKKFWKFW